MRRTIRHVWFLAAPFAGCMSLLLACDFPDDSSANNYTPPGGDGNGNGESSDEEGDDCSVEGTLVCGKAGDASVDNAALLCQGGTLVSVFQCPGLQDCTASQDKDYVDCGGTSYSRSGAPCANEGVQVCSFDQMAVNVCKSGYWITGIHCPPSTCANLPENEDALCWGHFCSNCGYSLGDYCAFPAGSVACSTDLSMILQCSNGVTIMSQDCGSSGQTCTSTVQDGMRVLTCM